MTDTWTRSGSSPPAPPSGSQSVLPATALNPTYGGGAPVTSGMVLGGGSLVVREPLPPKPTISPSPGTSRYRNSRPDCPIMDAVYLTAAQVAEIVQVDEKTVLRWSLEDASMPVLRRGRVVRFPRERLLAWLQRQEPRASAQGRRKATGDDAK